MSGFVYAIESGEAVKIGYAADPVRRLSELNVGAPGAHRLIGFARGSKQHEREIHAICQAERLRGEWFRKVGRVLIFLDLLPKYLPAKPRPAPRAFMPRTSRRKLTEYLTKNRLTNDAFAERVGVTAWAVRKWRNGERIPRPSIIQRIVKATDGALTPADFIPQE